MFFILPPLISFAFFFALLVLALNVFTRSILIGVFEKYKSVCANLTASRPVGEVANARALWLGMVPVVQIALYLLIAFGMMMPSESFAQSSGEGNERPFNDAEVRLPPYPKPGNLIQFAPGFNSSSHFYVDPGSVSTVGDGEARYTLVVVSAGGARNVSYEGIHCRTVEHRYYAFGRSDGSWSSVRSNEWRGIGSENTNLQRVLYWDYFCPSRTYGGSAKDAIDRLRTGAQLHGRVRLD